MIVNGVLAALVHRIVHLHDTSLVATSVTVVGRRKDCDHLPVVLPLVPLHNKLVGTGNEMKAVDMGELLCDILPKGVPGSPW
jgi:hypothetical protein